MLSSHPRRFLLDLNSSEPTHAARSTVPIPTATKTKVKIETEEVLRPLEGEEEEEGVEMGREEEVEVEGGSWRRTIERRDVVGRYET